MFASRVSGHDGAEPGHEKSSGERRDAIHAKSRHQSGDDGKSLGRGYEASRQMRSRHRSEGQHRSENQSKYCGSMERSRHGSGMHGPCHDLGRSRHRSGQEGSSFDSDLDSSADMDADIGVYSSGSMTGQELHSPDTKPGRRKNKKIKAPPPGSASYHAPGFKAPPSNSLLAEILTEKKRMLMRSPEVIAALDSLQKELSDKKQAKRKKTESRKTRSTSQSHVSGDKPSLAKTQCSAELARYSAHREGSNKSKVVDQSAAVSAHVDSESLKDAASRFKTSVTSDSPGTGSSKSDETALCGDVTSADLRCESEAGTVIWSREASAFSPVGGMTSEAECVTEES